MNLAHEAFIHWRNQYKILLRTFSDEQMFTFGFQAADKVNEVMQDVVSDLQTQVAELTARLEKLDKPKAKKSE